MDKAVKKISAALLAAVLAVMLIPAAFSQDAYAAKNATNYEKKQGPHDDGAIYINDYEGKHYDVFMEGKKYTSPKGASYDPEDNTLTLKNFVHPAYEISVREMGDDFTINVNGECEIARILVTGWEHEGMDENGNPLYWGGGLNFTGSGKLTISNTTGNEADPYGIWMDCSGCDSVLKISKYTSLKVCGYDGAPAIMMLRSAGFYDDKVITVGGRNLASVYPKYPVKGFMSEADPILKDYWVDSSKVIIKGVKSVNPLKIKAKTATVKYSNLKKKTQTLPVTRVINFLKKGKGTMTYTKVSGNKKITVNKKTGKVTVRKGLKKATYKIKVKVKAAGNSSYKPSTVKTVTFKIKVK